MLDWLFYMDTYLKLLHKFKPTFVYCFLLLQTFIFVVKSEKRVYFADVHEFTFPMLYMDTDHKFSGAV